MAESLTLLKQISLFSSSLGKVPGKSLVTGVRSVLEAQASTRPRPARPKLICHHV